VLVSGIDGIVVNAGSSEVVNLKGLDIEGAGTGTHGISFLAGKGLTISNCIIRGFVTNAVNFAPGTANASLAVENTIVADNPGGGILIAPTGGFVAKALVTKTHMVRNVFDLRVQDDGKASVSESSALGNTNNGFLAVSTSTSAEIDLTHSVTANNGTNGIQSNGTNAIVRIAYTSILDNTSGISLANGGTVLSSSPATNANVGNGTPGAPNGSAASLE